MNAQLKERVKLKIPEILSCETRVKILKALTKFKKGIWSTRLGRVIGESRQLVEHHLKYLKNIGIVKTWKFSKKRYWKLNWEKTEAISILLKALKDSEKGFL